MRVSIIGLGYVGLVSGACLAEIGHDVVCVDVDRDKVDQVNNGITPIFEKGLGKLLSKHINKKFRATTNLSSAIQNTEISIIAVGTPFDGEQIDLRYIKDSANQIGNALKDKTDYHTIVVKSTVIPGTTDEVVLPILEEASGKKAGANFGVGMNPEFLREGEAVSDFLYPDRIVMGAIDEKALGILKRLYRPFENTDKISTNNKTAEMIKYTSNSLLATMISFSNEIANLCAALGDVDVADVMQAVHLDKRLSPIMPNGERLKPAFTTFIEAGCGFGGSCFPKDVKALISHGKTAGQSMQLLESVVRINDKQPLQLLKLLKKHFPELTNIVIAILGLAFKPGTDDMRESPAIPVINILRDEKAVLRVYDPVALNTAKKELGDNKIIYCETINQAIKDAQAVILLTRWDEFLTLPKILQKEKSYPVVIDGRRMLDKNEFDKYEGIGLS
jgi:UDPglucose 6-dehydrogenase/GDP-mannose 6-dehydrogenase